jgi:hypothetical protein
MAHPYDCGRSVGDGEECKCGVEAIVVRPGGFMQEITKADNVVVRLQV